MGAGVTGIVATYLLKKAGLRVALLERERIASRDSGHTTAHLTCVTDKRLHELVNQFGRQHAKAAWDAGAAAIDEIESIVKDENIACEFSRVPGYLHAPVSGGQSDERANLRKDAKLANEFGFNAAYLDHVPFMNTQGVRFADQAKFHPLKFLFALAKKIHGAGCYIFENSVVKEFDLKKKRAKANGQWISYDRIVLATNNPLLGESGLIKGMIFQMKLALYSSYVIGATVPRGSITALNQTTRSSAVKITRQDRREIPKLVSEKSRRLFSSWWRKRRSIIAGPARSLSLTTACLTSARMRPTNLLRQAFVETVSRLVRWPR